MWFDTNTTVFLEAGVYSVILAIIIGIVYATPFSNLDIFSNKQLTAILSQFSTTTKKEAPISNQPSSTKPHPRNWWTDEKTFQLERRAIFSKTWLFTTHATHFLKPGDYHTFEVASFAFILILGKDHTLRGFHNVCRHRAYAVVQKDRGSSLVLGCRYHGWSYDTRGKLVKAPEFEGVEGFEKGGNGLWEIGVRVVDGAVWVCFDVGAVRQGKGEEERDVGGVSRAWGVQKMKLVEGWKMEGRFNWKVAEGLPFGHQTEPTTSVWDTLKGLFDYREEQTTPSPSVQLIRLRSGNLLTIRTLPLSKSRTFIECNLYSKTTLHRTRTRNEINQLKSALQVRLTNLESLQRKLTSGTAELASAPLDAVQRLCAEHSEAEKIIGHEIYPAARHQTFTQDGKDDDDLCKELDRGFEKTLLPCGMDTKNELEW